MLAMLGDFFFTINSNGYQKLWEHLSFSYAEHAKAQGNTSYEAVRATDHFISMEGTLIMQPNSSLEPLKRLGRNKKPVLLVFRSGYAFWVIIQELDIDYSGFISGGAATRRDFRVNLTRVHYGNKI